MLMTAYQLGFGGGGGKALVSKTDNAVLGTDLTTYTFSGKSIGVAAQDRKIVVGVTNHASTDRTVSSVTVGGISATQVVTSGLSVANGGQADLWQADVPTGTTGDVVVVFSGGALSCGIGVWRVTGAKATALATASHKDADPLTTTIDVPTGGIIIAKAMGRDAGGTLATAWTGVTESFEEQVEGNFGHTGAQDEFIVGEAARTVSADHNAEDTTALAVASWAPS